MAQRFDVYVSYSRSDRGFARSLVQALHERNLSVFVDFEGIAPGQNWAAALEEALGSSAAVVVLLGAEPLSELRREELATALERVPVVIPVPVPGYRDDSGLPSALRERQWLDMRGGLEGADIDLLVLAIESASGGGSRPGTPPTDLRAAQRSVEEVLSETVRGAATELGPVPVTATALALAICRRHPQYAGGRAARLRADTDDGERRTALDWLAAVAGVVNPRAGRVIHGRLAIAGLARIDAEARAALEADGFLEALLAEIKEVPDDLFLPSVDRADGAVYAPAALAGDRAAPRDDLGVGTYADAFAQLILLQQTEPLTVAVHGDGGRGKSTFMRLVERDLVTGALGESDPQVAELRALDASGGREVERRRLWDCMRRRAAPEVISVWFNAWRYQGPTEVWAGLASEVTRGLEESLSSRRLSWRRLRLRLGYAWTHRKTELLMSVLLPVVALAALVLTLGYAGADALAENAGSDGGTGGAFGDALRVIVPAGSVALVVWYAYSRFRDVAQRISDRVLSYIRLPDYGDQTGLQHRVIQDLRFAYDRVGSQTGRRPEGGGDRVPSKVVVFVDDLDRCSDEKIIETLEAIFLVLAESGFFVFVGMDTAMIHRAIGAHYGVPADGDNGAPAVRPDRYLRKIIQLSFYLPPVEPAQRFALLRSLFSDAARFSPLAGDGTRGVGPGSAMGEPELEGTGALPPRAETAVRPAGAGAPVRERTPVEDTAAELAAFESLQEYLEPNPREIKRLINLHRYVKLVLQGRDPTQSWTEDEQRKLVKLVVGCGGGITDRKAFDAADPLLSDEDRAPETPLGRRLVEVQSITQWIGAPDRQKAHAADNATNVPASGSRPRVTR